MRQVQSQGLARVAEETKAKWGDGGKLILCLLNLIFDEAELEVALEDFDPGDL